MDKSEVDVLRIYFGDPIKIDESITIYQPTIGDILDFGEKEFWHIANQVAELLKECD